MRSRLVWLVALPALVALSACGELYGVTATDVDPDARIDGMRDTPTTGDAPDICASFAIQDDFDEPQPCNMWGAPFNNSGGSVDDRGSLLEITPGGGTNGCTSNAELTLSDGGMFVKVVDALTATGGYTAIQATGQPGFGFGILNGDLIFSDLAVSVPAYGRRTYEPDTMRWLRLRHDSSTGATAADFSSDGTSWSNLAQTTGDIGSGSLIILTSVDGPGAGGPAQFDSFRVCQ